MRTLKKLVAIVLVALLSGASLWGQPDMSRNKVIEGSNGKMIIFYGLENWKSVLLSRNGRFVIGQSESSGFIYEIATEKYKYFESSYVVDVVDWDNYITSSYAQIDGEEYFDYQEWNTGTEAAGGNAFSIVAASKDLSVFMATSYLKDMFSHQTRIFDTKTGQPLDTLDFFIEPEANVVSTGMAMSEDGKVVVGRASVHADAYTNMAPTFWDRDRNAITYAGTDYTRPGEISDGELGAISNDGTFMVGEDNGKACIIHYDRTAGTFTKEFIPLWGGSDVAYAWGVSDNHVVIGVEQPEATEAGTRIPYIYFADSKTKYNLADYVHYLYGLDAEQDMPLYSPYSLSGDARCFTGFSFAGGQFYPYVVILDATQAYAPALNVQARQNLGTANVQLNWDAPMQGDYTLQGYNVYRGETKVTPTLLAADVTTFLDQDVPAGTQAYSVEAVYTDGAVAPKSEEVSLYVIDPNGCLPVQNIYVSVEYNRTVQLNWDLPSADAPAGKRASKGGEKDLDPAGFFQPGASTMSAAVKVGDYIYVASLGGGFTIYDAYTQKAVQNVERLGFTSVYDMAFHDGIFWVVCGTDQIIELSLDPQNPLDVSLSRVWSSRISEVTHIAYVENDDASVNNGRDYLALGDYETILFYPTTATGPTASFSGAERLEIEGLTIGGSEYHNGNLYLTDQNGSNGCDLVTFDLATGKKLHSQNLFENARIASYVGGSVSYPLGLTKATLDDGTVVLECLMQSEVSTPVVVDLEVESAPNVLGYRVYRDNKPVSDTLVKRHFEEEILEPGTYVYSIEYLDKKGCSINSSVVGDTAVAVITAIGDCTPPSSLQAYESNRSAVLTWEDGTTGGLVGFNIYRNGELVSEPRLVDHRFMDASVEMNVPYTYVVEAFYNNSCVASDTVEITITGKGSAHAPSAFSVEGVLRNEGDETFDVKASWQLPFFEEPMAYGYCGYPAASQSIGDVSEVYCVIGWAAEDLDQFDDDLYLVGVEFMLGSNDVENIRTVVYADDAMVHMQPYSGSKRPEEWVWLRDYFTKPFSMKQEMEIGVGYAVSYNPEEVSQVFVYDRGPGKPQYSDLISGNGEQFDYLGRMGIDANLCINALVVRYRDLEAAASAADPQAYLAEKVMTVNASLKLSDRAAQAPAHARKATSEGVKLLGFNVYRDEEKVNESLLTGLEYTDANLSRGREEYEYRVSAVYEGADEQFSDYLYVYTEYLDNDEAMKDAGVSVYPNPSAGAFNLRMTYAGTVEVYDMTGRVVSRESMTAGVHSLSLERSGIYMMRILSNGKTVTVKLVVR